MGMTSRRCRHWLSGDHPSCEANHRSSFDEFNHSLPLETPLCLARVHQYPGWTSQPGRKVLRIPCSMRISPPIPCHLFPARRSMPPPEVWSSLRVWVRLLSQPLTWTQSSMARNRRRGREKISTTLTSSTMDDYLGSRGRLWDRKWAIINYDVVDTVVVRLISRWHWK